MDGQERSGDAWLGDYAARATEFWQRTATSTSELAARWGDRSLGEGNWTVDTVTADLIEAWEELTPLVGEGLELWLQLVQQSLNAGRPRG